MLSDALALTVIVPLTAVPAAGPVMATVGGVLSTVTLTAAEVTVLPAASRAVAVNVCDPSATPAVFHATAYGADVFSAPSGAPSTKNCTPATPMLSAALALTVIVPLTAVPADGAVMAAVGGVLSTVTLTAAEESVVPAASRATAVKVCEPSATLAVFHATAYGADVSSAPIGAPSTKKRTPATPMLSEALALMVTVPLRAAPAEGAVMAAVGAVLSTVTLTAAEVVVLPVASRATTVRVCEPSAT